MKQLFKEILIEIPKLKDKDYECCVIVHPEDVEEVLKFINSAAVGHYKESTYVEFNRYFSRIKVNGCISIATTQTKDWFMVEHAGMQYTTILIDLDAFGKNVFDSDGNYANYVPVNKDNVKHGFDYMISRLRPMSQYSPRMVIC